MLFNDLFLQWNIKADGWLNVQTALFYTIKVNGDDVELRNDLKGF